MNEEHLPTGIQDALAVYRYIVIPANTSAQEPSGMPIREMSDGPGVEAIDAYIPAANRIIHVSGIHRAEGSPVGRWPKTRLDAAFECLQKIGVVSGIMLRAGKGRATQIRFFNNVVFGPELGKNGAEVLEHVIHLLLEADSAGHELTADDQDDAVGHSKVEAVRVLADVSLRFVDGSRKFVQAGTIISDYQNAQYMLASGAAVAALEVGDDATIACPSGHMFKTSAQLVLDMVPVILLTDCYFSFNGVTISKKKNDLVADGGMIKQILGDGAINAIVAKPSDYAACPKCQTAFLLPLERGNHKLTAELRIKYAAEAAIQREVEAARRLEQERQTAELRTMREAESEANAAKLGQKRGISRLGS